MVGKQVLFLLLLFTFKCVIINAQDLNFDENVRRLIERGGQSDSTDETTNNAIHSTQTTNRTQQSAASATSGNRSFRRNEKLPMSEEALYWSRSAADSLKVFCAHVTFQDTVIVNPLFLPPVFKPGHVWPEKKLIIYQPSSFFTANSWEKPLFKPVKLFEKEMIKYQIQTMAYRHIQRYLPSAFQYSIDELPAEKVTIIENKEEVQILVESRNANPTEFTAPVKFIPDRKYWISSFESAVKFSENSTSDNWHSGPTKTTILNLFTKNIVKYNYAKDRIKLDNDLELRLNFFNSPNDSLRTYKVSDDFLRLHSNFGLRAYNNWYYSFDAEFKTQLFANYQENTMFTQAAFMSPYTINFGLGMKYDFAKQYERIDRSLAGSVNIAPLAYTYMSSVSDSIDWGRHGFPKDEQTDTYKKYLSRFGSTVDFQMTLKPNRDVTWKSRIRYFTSYDRVVAEFENSLDFAVSRFFSTLLFLHIRYDDGVTKVSETDSFIQWNQLISFGFNYKW